ncbi:MAG: AMP-binding protein [Dehalococcoidia bacterium]
METLVDLLSASARKYGEREAVWMEHSGGTDAWSYQDLWRAASNSAFYLHQQGVGAGERVLVYSPNSPRLAAAYFALFMLGAIAVPIDMRSSPQFIQRVRDRSRSHTLLAAGAPPAELSDVHLILLSELPVNDHVETGNWKPQPPQPDDLAEIVFTSGTTGRPKGVMLTHRNITANAEACSVILRDVGSFRALSIMPLSHMLEQIALYAGLFMGATFSYVETLAPNKLFDVLRRRRITLIPSVPQILQLFYKGIEAEVRRQGKTRAFNAAHLVARRAPFPLRRRLFAQVHKRLGGHLRFFFCGGAYLPPELQAAWERLGVKVVQGYGTTECSPVVTGNTPACRVLGSVGRPIPGVEVKLSEDGEILVKGPNVTAGYFEDPEATATAFSDGWYRTKDLGVMDSEGNLFVKGRKDDMIVLPDGQNLYPEDIENALRKQAAVRDAVVFGLPRGRGVQLHAVVLPEPHENGIDVSPDEIADAVRAANRALANYQRIDSHQAWGDEDFPRTHTLKVKRSEVLAAVPEAP